MIYNHRLVFVQDILSVDLTEPQTLFILKDDSLDESSFPLNLIYQNNQDRNVTLRSRFSPEHIEGNEWCFGVEGVVTFTWESHSPLIRYRYGSLGSDELFVFWLYHIVLPIYFSIRRIYQFLHAGAVEIGGRAVLFMAPSHGGKSTLTDYFLRQDLPLITDDKLGTFERDGVYYAVPSHPYHRPYRTMEVLGDECSRFVDQPREIGVIYMLEKVPPEGEITIRPLRGIEKFSRLHEGGEMNFSFLNTQYVEYLSQFANSVAVFAITIPQDKERLQEVYETIMQHSELVKS